MESDQFYGVIRVRRADKGHLVSNFKKAQEQWWNKDQIAMAQAPQTWDKCEPMLSISEPLLLEQQGSHSRPVANVFWHRILGLLSISIDGSVLVADTSGIISYSVPAIAGRSATITAADLSLELEQLAVASQRGVHLWQCLSQTKEGVLDPSDQGTSSPALLVRYLPTQRFLISVHEVGGAVFIWDARRLEMFWQLNLGKECPRATCVGWDPQAHLVMIFGHMGVVEVQINESELVASAAAAALPKRRKRQKARKTAAAHIRGAFGMGLFRAKASVAVGTGELPRGPSSLALKLASGGDLAATGKLPHGSSLLAFRKPGS